MFLFENRCHNNHQSGQMATSAVLTGKWGPGVMVRKGIYFNKPRANFGTSFTVIIFRKYM